MPNQTDDSNINFEGAARSGGMPLDPYGRSVAEMHSRDVVREEAFRGAGNAGFKPIPQIEYGPIDGGALPKWVVVVALVFGVPFLFAAVPGLQGGAAVVGRALHIVDPIPFEYEYYVETMPEAQDFAALSLPRLYARHLAKAPKDWKEMDPTQQLAVKAAWLRFISHHDEFRGLKPSQKQFFLVAFPGMLDEMASKGDKRALFDRENLWGVPE